jgi:hypothetical protein
MIMDEMIDAANEDLVPEKVCRQAWGWPVGRPA